MKHALMRTALLLSAALLPLLAAAVWGVWTGFADTGLEMSVHGWIALALGVVLSIALGVGLMALVFFSHRRGFDERAHWDDGGQDT